MPRAALASVLVALLASLACSRDEDEKPQPTGERTKEPAPEVPKDAPTGPFAGFDFAGAAQRWQGAWILGADVQASVAWHLQGTALEEARRDGGTSAFTFAVYSPCQVSYTDQAAGETTYKNFAFDGELLYAGTGAAGIDIGTSTVVCAGDGSIYVLNGSRCETWSELFDDWKAKPSTCAIEERGGTRRFVAGDLRLNRVGEVWLDEAMAGQAARWYPDLAAARAALGSDAG